MRTLIGGVVAAGLLLPSVARVESPSETWNGLPDRFQLDTGYFRINVDAVLRFNGPQGGSDQVDFSRDLGEDPNVNTFWLEGMWRLGRRHQIKLAYTRSSNTGTDYTLQRDFSWGGQARPRAKESRVLLSSAPEPSSDRGDHQFGLPIQEYCQASETIL